MKHRLLEINVNDLIIDPDGQAEMISAACRRSLDMEAKGLLQMGDRIVVLLVQSTPGGHPQKYVFAPFETLDISEMVSEIGTRFYSGFSLIGGIDVNNEKWALYCHDEKNVAS